MIYLEAEIIFKNNCKDWVSPIDNIDNNIIIDTENNKIYINNGFYTYEFILNHVKCININEIDASEEYNIEIINSQVYYNI